MHPAPQSQRVSPAVSNKARHMLFKIWRFTFLEKRKCSSGKTIYGKLEISGVNLTFFLLSVRSRPNLKIFFLRFCLLT
jgi:hypothetical protein